MFGATFAPEILQVIMEILALAAIEQVGATGVVKSRVHIDNVRFISLSQKILDKVGDRFEQLCAQCNLTLNKELCNSTHQTGSFLGLDCDYANGTVCVAEKTLDKIRHRAHTVFEDTKATVRDGLSLFSSCIFASRALRLSPAEFFVVFKFIRRRLAQPTISMHHSTCGTVPRHLGSSGLNRFTKTPLSITLLLTLIPMAL